MNASELSQIPPENTSPLPRTEGTDEAVTVPPGEPETWTWGWLKQNHPLRYQLYAKACWRDYAKHHPEDVKLDRAYREDKATGFDLKLAVAGIAPERPPPWKRNGLRLPPFGKDIAQRLQKSADLRIFCGPRGWDPAGQCHRLTRKPVALIHDGQPEAYDLGFVAGRTLLLISTGASASEFKKTIHHLLAAGAGCVVAISGDSFAVYRSPS